MTPTETIARLRKLRDAALKAQFDSSLNDTLDLCEAATYAGMEWGIAATDALPGLLDDVERLTAEVESLRSDFKWLVDKTNPNDWMDEYECWRLLRALGHDLPENYRDASEEQQDMVYKSENFR